MTSPETPKPYSLEDYEEQLRAAEGQDFPEELVFGSEAWKKANEKQGFTGVMPRGNGEAWEDESLLNDQDKWDRETAWHHLANPYKPLTARHREFCRLIARGLPYVEIGKIIGYSQGYMSQLSCQPKLRHEVDRIVQVQLEASIDERMKQMNHRAFDVIEKTIMDEQEKPALRFEASKWLLEKTTGKAKQEIESRDGNLADFMSLLRETAEQQKKLPEGGARRNTSAEGETIDVTPAAPKGQDDSLARWVDSET